MRELALSKAIVILWVPVTTPGDTFSISYKIVSNFNLKFIVLPNTIESIEELPEAANNLENS